MQIAYDRASDPVTLDLQIASDDLGVARFDYAFAGYADGRGKFDYAFRNQAGDLLEVRPGYDATGAGLAAALFTPSGGGGPTGSFQQCWDSSACLTYVSDEGNWSGACEAAPCGFGTAADRTQGHPAPPFVKRPSSKVAPRAGRLHAKPSGSGRPPVQPWSERRAFTVDGTGSGLRAGAVPGDVPEAIALEFATDASEHRCGAPPAAR